jgi:hypothetical protein
MGAPPRDGGRDPHRDRARRGRNRLHCSLRCLCGRMYCPGRTSWTVPHRRPVACVLVLRHHRCGTGRRYLGRVEPQDHTDHRCYPAIEKFLWLAATFVICVIIAVVRQRIDAAVLQSQHRRERSRRRQMSDAEQSNQRLNARVRDYDRTSGEGQADRTDRPDRSTQATRPYRTTGDASDAREERRTDDYPRYSAPRDENRRYSTRRDEPEKADSPETRTRTAAELREASRRRRSRSQDRPLDMD